MATPSPPPPRALRFWERGRKAVCVGRNYAEHARELGNPLPQEPVLFLKPPTAFVREQGPPLRAPWFCSSLHHEVELGVVVGRAGSCISQAAAMEHVAGYALCLDMTARDAQEACKSKGLPWTLAKAFDGSCPVSDFIPKERIPDPHDLNIWLEVNGERRQDGHTSNMIFSIPFLINYISSFMTLQEGDLILTGTPRGVAAVQEGDELVAGISGVVTMRFRVAARAPRP
ncbi:oxaloacetate tautomerase FAHD1, mitochondrial [Lampetra planeri]